MSGEDTQLPQNVDRTDSPSLFDLDLLHREHPFTLPAPGEKITSQLTGNTYSIGNQIGEGAFGVVFGCTDVWENHLVAKLLKPDSTGLLATERKAQHELAVLVQARHPNIIYVYDAFVYKGAFYIISERCDQTLADLISISDFRPLNWFRPIARCVLQAIQFTHLMQMVHCDIHLRNVFAKFQPDEILPQEYAAVTFKLGDFGLARPFGTIPADGTFLDSIRPPEAINPDEFGPLDKRIDIYHAGLLFLQVLHGKPIAFTREQITSGYPRELALQLPHPHAFALEKMLRRHVMFRAESAMEVWRDLNSPAPTSASA